MAIQIYSSPKSFNQISPPPQGYEEVGRNLINKFSQKCCDNVDLEEASIIYLVAVINHIKLI